MSRGNGLFIYIVKWTLEDVPVELSVSLCHVLVGTKRVRRCWVMEGSTWENWPGAVFYLKCSAGFSAMPDLVSVRSLAFLDGPTAFDVCCYSSRKEGNQNGRWGCHHRHPREMGYMREGHTQFRSTVGTVCVLLFKDPKGGKKKIFEWGMVFCGALTGFAEIE